MKDLRDRVTRGAILALFLQGGGAGCAYLLQIGLAHFLGPEELGIYTYTIAWVTIFSWCASFGFPMSVLRLIPEYSSDSSAGGYLQGIVRMSRRASLGLGCGLGAGLFVAGITVLPPEITKSTAMMAVGGLLIPLGALMNLDSAILRARGSILAAYGPMLVARPLLVVFAVGIVSHIDGSISATEAGILTCGIWIVVAVAQACVLAYRRILMRTTARYLPATWFRASFPLLLVSAFQLLLSQTDLLIVGAVGGSTSAAYYNAAAKTALLVSLVTMAYNAVAAPVFTELEVRGDRAQLQELATTAVRSIFLPTAVIAAGIALLATPLMSIFGSGFTAAKPTLMILLIGQVFSAACGSVGYLIIQTGYQKDAARVYGVMAALNAVLCYAGARDAGLAGAAIGTTISIIAWNIWLAVLCEKRIGISATLWSAVKRRPEPVQIDQAVAASSRSK